MKLRSRLRSGLLSALNRDCRHFANGHACAAAPACTTIASYNIHKCVGVDGRFDPGRIAEVISEIGADVIALQEVDRRFGEREGLLDLDALHRATGLVAVEASRRPRSHGWHGNTLLYREGSVNEVRTLTLPGVEPRGALIVDLELEAGHLRVVAAHLGLLRRSRKRQLRTLVAAAAGGDPRPTLLLGDFNEWRIGSRSSLRGLHPEFGPVHAAVPSFPARYPVLALDRVLARPHDLVRKIEVHDTPLARIASDHLPVKASLSLAGAYAVIGGETAATVAA